MATKEYLDMDGLKRFYDKLVQKYGVALQFKGTVQDVAALPTLGVGTTQVPGYVYNITDEGVTTGDFVEGAGHVLRAGSNVAVINVATAGSPEVLKFDILAGFFSVDDKLTFGSTMPSTPAQGDTFLYMGITTYEYNAVTPIGTENPHDEGWYEEVSGTPGTYQLTADTTVTSGKTYYTKDEEYVTGVIYVYDTTNGWEPQSSGDTIVPITNNEIDSLFD